MKNPFHVDKGLQFTEQDGSSGGVSRVFRFLAGVVALTAYSWSAPIAAMQTNAGIKVLTAQFGTLGGNQKLDISARLQQLCGAGSVSCSVFCSETSFGLSRLGRRPICRVAYRCPDASTRSVEAAKEEPILMRCGDGDAEQVKGEVEFTTPGQPQPPPYVAPTPVR